MLKQRITTQKIEQESKRGPGPLFLILALAPFFAQADRQNTENSTLQSFFVPQTHAYTAYAG